LKVGPGLNLVDFGHPIDISQVKKDMTQKILAMRLLGEYLSKALVLAEDYLSGLDMCLLSEEDVAMKVEKGKGHSDGSVSA
jgi:hypothetical protein